jgi:hypothetical protein
MKITKSELKNMIREVLREELSLRTSITESADMVQGFNVGDKIVAKNDVYYGPAFDVFDDEYDHGFISLDTNGFISSADDIIFNKGTKFEIVDYVNGNPVLKELSTGLELDFFDLTKDFELI